MEKRAEGKKRAEIVFLVILALYPLRHICWGLDLWDTGYNYANFQYMGTEHMDSMWLFSTYLANCAGHFLSMLPGGRTLAGMNFYTGLFVTLLVLAGYFFCTRCLKIPAWITFVGELVAASLCWSPTAVLYNYLTYVLFLGGAILLYLGLTENKRTLLAGAGACLGANVLVRFSNLPEAGLILAVWAYDFILWRQEKKESRAGGREQGAGFWKRLLSHTGWCLLGYLSALGVLLFWIAIRYGLDSYWEGILRLFAMTETATDYKAASMVTSLLETYVENLYWAVRIGVILAVGLLLAGLLLGAEALAEKWQLTERGSSFVRFLVKLFWALVSFGVLFCRMYRRGLDSSWLLLLGAGLLVCLLTAAAPPRLIWAAGGAGMLVWLYGRGFCSLDFYSYGAILRPGVLFLMLAMLIALLRIADAGSAREEKLISGMILLIVLLTALGSNNKVYPSLNNLFLAAPYTLWESWRFLGKSEGKEAKVRPGGGRLTWLRQSAGELKPPAKGLLAAFLLMCLFQFGGFGAGFAFAEGTGVQEVSASVDNNEVLKHIKMNPKRAVWMEEISGFVDKEGLQGREVILYGGIPALSFYLQMPSAFNPWSDLDSYSRQSMEQALARTAGSMEGGEKEAPVIIMEKNYGVYIEQGAEGLETLDIPEGKKEKLTKDAKLLMLMEFMQKWDYCKVFENDKFVLYLR